MVLILGSGPDVLDCRDWPRAPFERIVAINNAWAVRPDWDDLVYPEDFPAARLPPALGPHQRLVGAEDFVPAQNRMGGFVYGGGTMAFTAGYWALDALRPRLIAYLGCDMIYERNGRTHFYGRGAPDPLRRDVTLRSLEAKSARLMIHAAERGCAVVNLSEGPSRLLAPRAHRETLETDPPGPMDFDADAVAKARALEAELGYFVPSGRYWEETSRFDPRAIDRLDALWREAVERARPGDPRSDAA